MLDANSNLFFVVVVIVANEPRRIVSGPAMDRGETTVFVVVLPAESLPLLMEMMDVGEESGGWK